MTSNYASRTQCFVVYRFSKVEFKWYKNNSRGT